MSDADDAKREVWAKQEALEAQEEEPLEKCQEEDEEWEGRPRNWMHGRSS